MVLSSYIGRMGNLKKMTFFPVDPVAMEALVDEGRLIGGNVEEIADGLVELEQKRIPMKSETDTGIFDGGFHGNDKVWSSLCTWA